MTEKRVSLRQLIAALEDMQAEKFAYVFTRTVTDICKHLEDSPTNDPFQRHTQADECQHTKTVNIGTMQSPGGALCLDCNTQIP